MHPIFSVSVRHNAPVLHVTRFITRPWTAVWAFGGAGGGFAMARWCRFTPVEARVESAWFQRLQLSYEEPLSTFAFNFNPVEARV